MKCFSSEEIKNQMALYEQQEGVKKTLLCGVISAALVSLPIQPAWGAKKEVTLSGENATEISENIIGTDGVRGTDGNNGGDGEDALIVNVMPGSSQQENILSVNSGINIRGGNGGQAGRRGDRNAQGLSGGQGGAAISGSNFTLINAGDISGGDGGAGGNGNGGGDAGEAGTAISGDDLTITNSGSITGGNGDEPGFSGYGDKSGGLSGTPTVGGAAISGNNLKISNNGYITAGHGGKGGGWASKDGDSGGTGANGGTAVSGNHLEINNSQDITGGQGGIGGDGGKGGYPLIIDGGTGGSGGVGGAAISGNDIKINNNGNITGGQGGSGGYGGDASRDERNPALGNGGNGGYGGKGGTAISGNKLEINNNGKIAGGQGGSGGDGGSYESNDNGDTGNGGNGGNGGDGGIAISGSNLTINNHGSILAGRGGDGGRSYSSDGVSGGNGKDGSTAISLNGGTNLLNLFSGSDIRGDIVLGNTGSHADGNSLTITNRDSGSSEIAGSLRAGKGTDVSVSGADVSFSGNAVFDTDSSLNMSAGSSHLTAGSVQFNSGAVLNVDTAMTVWKQNDYSLLTASQGINGLSGDNIHQNNKLLSDGAEDYVITSLIGNGQTVNEVTSSLRWNDSSGNGYGTFDLRSGAVLELDVQLADNNAALLSSGWDGKSLTKAGEGSLILSSENTYTGVTDIRGGILLMNSNSALGQTSEVLLAADTMLDMNGHSQTVGKLNATADSVLNINDGNLTLTEGGVSAGTLTGNGYLNINGGVLDITGANSSLEARTTIAKDAVVQMNNAQGLGTAAVDNRGTLVVNNTTDGQLANDVSGTGNFRKTGTGSLTVGSNAAWTGQTDIDAGSLILGKVDAPVMLASSQVNIAEQGTLSGFGGVAGNVTNRGTIDLTSDAPGNVLIVGGNYTGNNGLLVMNTVLGDDNSATDKLVIKGNATGQTHVAVTQAGGSGAQTLNGIELIHVDGNADSAEFVQTGRIAAGAYDYTLGRGQGANSGNWYLTSGKNTREPGPGGYDNDLRPEAGTYTSNIVAANTMFVTRLHKRLGKMQFTDAITGEQKKTSMWMRHEGGHNRWRDGSGQLKTQGNRYVLQMGGDLAQWSQDGTERWHLGVMAGYGNDHNSTDSVRTGYRSKGSVNGYSTGLYATWYADDETHNGAYLDSWAQYSWFDNHVKGDGLQSESWKSKGLTASLETGYTWKAGEFTGSKGSLNEWYVQPQAQVVWMGVKADEHRESNGTRVESTGDGNVRTRLGVKTWIKSHNQMDEGKSREFNPFVEVNWLHNTRNFGTRMNDVTVHQDGARNIGELKVGVEGQINSRLNLWGSVGVQAGDKGYNDTSAMLGMKYTF